MQTEHYTALKKKIKRRPTLDLVVIFFLAVAVYYFAAILDLFERVVAFVWKYEKWELDEIIIVSVFLAFALAIFSLRRWQEGRVLKNRLVRQNKNLQEAISEIKQLKGLFNKKANSEG